MAQADSPQAVGKSISLSDNTAAALTTPGTCSAVADITLQFLETQGYFDLPIQV